MPTEPLLLGIDGGGTKTVAWLACAGEGSEPAIIGRGSAGPANPQTVGFPTALENLDLAIEAAFYDQDLSLQRVSAAVLALAGSDRQENRHALSEWAERRRLADCFRIVHDAEPVLAAGTPEGWGIALIAGTGSLAFGRDREGRTARAGGWGFLFGDEGSGYAIGVEGLRAAAKAADKRGPETRLLDALLSRLGLHQPEALIPVVYAIAGDRARLAALSGTVAEVAEQGDAVALGILHGAGEELARMVAAAARKLDFTDRAFPLALAGGVVLGSARVRQSLRESLAGLGLRTAPVQSVSEPVLGAVKLAAAIFGGA